LKKEYPAFAIWDGRRLRELKEKQRIEKLRVRIFTDASFERNLLTSNSNLPSGALRARRQFGPGSNAYCTLRELGIRCGGSRDERARGSR
jgi:hypothetical protein